MNPAKQNRIKTVLVAKVSGKEFGIDFSNEPVDMRSLRHAAKKWARANIVGTFENKESSIQLEIRNKGVDDAFQHGGAADKIRAFAAVKSLAENGAVIYNGTNPKHPQNRLVIVVGRVSISGRDMYVTAGFREDANGRLFYDHELLEVERAERLSSQWGAANLVEHPLPSAHLNDYTASFLNQEHSSSKVVDEETGEVLAEMAQTKPEIGFVKRAIAAIRSWLRENVPYFKDMALSDAEIINQFIMPARRYVENVSAKSNSASGALLSRAGDAESQVKDTEKAYGGVEAYNKAKEAGKTKLNYRQWIQVRTPNFKNWFGDWESAKIITGEPIAKLTSKDAPSGGFAEIESWAADIFAKQGGKATRGGIGDILLDHRAAQTSMAHGGANKYKKVAFAAVKDVIERGALVWQGKDGREDSFYFSAPVDIDGVSNIETVVVHRDYNTKRMYLHSITTKENLLKQRVSSVDAEASELSGSIGSEGITRILQNLINWYGLRTVDTFYVTNYFRHKKEASWQKAFVTRTNLNKKQSIRLLNTATIRLKYLPG